MTDQLPIPGMPEEFGTGDALDRFYTPQRLADAIVFWLARDVLDRAPDVVIEPSVGGGAFVRSVRKRWPDACVFGCDIDPSAAGLSLCDWARAGDWVYEAPTIMAGLLGPVLVLGNAPFDDAISHWLAAPGACEGSLVQALIMPHSCPGVAVWQQPFRDAKPRLVRPILGRPWQDSVRETAVYCYESRHRGGTELVFPALPWKPSHGMEWP
jgi:hypothetical protein